MSSQQLCKLPAGPAELIRSNANGCKRPVAAVAVNVAASGGPEWQRGALAVPPGSAGAVGNPEDEVGRGDGGRPTGATAGCSAMRLCRCNC
mmetsp:Transcript_127415/g.318097  ORF Transcript_127415/g.318097 Transcript_127415/m.318097 type:complete len:91 (+) Transcript_127415:60-332(+)